MLESRCNREAPALAARAVTRSTRGCDDRLLVGRQGGPMPTWTGTEKMQGFGRIGRPSGVHPALAGTETAGQRVVGKTKIEKKM